MLTKPKYAMILDVIGLCLLCIAMLVFAWVGHNGSDDRSYIHAAQGWIESFPFIGESHWALRHTLVIPMAFSFVLFGIGEFTSILPSLIYYIALVLCSYTILSYIIDRKTGVMSALLIATLPLFAINGTMCVPDIAEVLYIFLAVAIFYIAAQKEQVVWLLCLAGVFIALAWYTRLTTVGLGLFFFYLCLLLAGHANDHAIFMY